MAILRIRNNARGRYTKKLFDYVLANHREDWFYYRHLPDVDPDFLKEVEQAMDTSSTFFISAPPSMAKSTILTELIREGLIVSDDDLGFKLTDLGKKTTMVMA